MIKISYLALTRLLLENGHRYITELSTKFDDRPVFNFMVGTHYPQTSNQYFLMGSNEDRENTRKDRESKVDSRIVMQYDVQNCCVLSTCYDFYQLVTKAKKEAINRALNIPSEPSDEDKEAVASVLTGSISENEG